MVYGLIPNLRISSDRVSTSCGTHRLDSVIATDALQWHTWHTASRGKPALLLLQQVLHTYIHVVSCKLYCVDLQMNAIYIMCYVVSTVNCVMLYAVCYVMLCVMLCYIQYVMLYTVMC